MLKNKKYKQVTNTIVIISELKTEYYYNYSETASSCVNIRDTITTLVIIAYYI